MAPAANSDDGLTGAEGNLETDAGPARAGRTGAPQRRCIATMEVRRQSEMIRFVLSPSGQVVADLAGRLPGRGAWVTATREAVQLAVKKGAFARAFKAPAKVAPGFADDIEKLLIKRALDQLGLAKRAGDLILGFEQVREAIRETTPACLIEASDGAEDGRGKVLALLHGVHGVQRVAQGEQSENLVLPPVAGCFSADELGMALGRGRVIHACLKQGRSAQGWMGELARLSGFRRVWLDDVRSDVGRPVGGLPVDDHAGTGGSPDGPGAKN